MSEQCHVMMTGHVTIVITWVVSLVIMSHPRDHNTAPSGVYSVFTLQQEALPGPAAVYIITYLQCLLSFLACVCLFECPASSPQQKSIQTSAYKLC